MRKIFGVSWAVMLLFSGLAAAQSTAYPSTSYTDAVPACVTTSNQAVTNLVACGIRFNALGEIEVTVKNLGTVGVNVPDPQSLRRSGSGTPIPIDVYMQGQRIESVYLQNIGANQTRTITLKIPSNYTRPACGETRTIAMVIDPASQVTESLETDNARTRTTDRPCPDMAIEYINKDWNSINTEFVAKVKLVNRGNAPVRFHYMAITTNSSSFGPIPSADHDAVMELEAGQAKTFTIGSALFTQTLKVRIHLDRWGEVEELVETNNYKEEVLNN